MKRIIAIENPTAIHMVHTCIGQDGVIVIPTDTIYGISAGYDRPLAIEKIYQLKKRSKEKALPVLIGSLDQLTLVAETIPDAAHQLVETFWPGALTIILPKRKNLPNNLSEYNTIGVRMPNFPFILELLQACGPLATTSANISGGTNPTRILEVLEQLPDGIDYYLNGGQTDGDIASTVVDCSSHEIRVLREGLISAEQIFSCLKKSTGD
jgi:L-threonylcarbamoyladenylate synthase